MFDDIQDRSPQRNHRPTTWGVWGVDQAINAGLALSCYARLALHGMAERGVSPGTLPEIQRLLEHTVIDLCLGQYLDIHYQSELPTLEQYVEMVRLKTGALLGAACETGALVAGAEEKRSAARKFGEALGIGFQLRDDYLGAWGNPQEMGKAADDLQERKWSLPLVVGSQPRGSSATATAAIHGMVQEWTLQAQDYLSEIKLPSTWQAAFMDLSQALVSRPA